MRKLLYILPILLLFLGCEAEKTDGAKRLEIQKKFDQGKTDEIIALLEHDASYQRIYPDNEYKLYLGSAYLARAGFDLDTVVDLLSDADADPGTDTSVINSTITDLATYIDIFASIKASENFSGALNIDCNDSNQLDLSYSQEEVCLFIGITGLLKTATTLSYIVDIEALLNSDGNTTVPAKTLATACALEYALASSDGNYTYVAPYQCDNNATVLRDGNVSFVPNTYEHIVVTVDINSTVESFAQLVNFAEPVRSTILVDGYCDTNYVSCDMFDYSLECHACPLAQGDVTLPSTNEILLDAINNDLSALVPLLPTDDNSTEVNAVDEFRNDIISSRDGNDTSPTITEQDLVNYFNSTSN